MDCGAYFCRNQFKLPQNMNAADMCTDTRKLLFVFTFCNYLLPIANLVTWQRAKSVVSQEFKATRAPGGLMELQRRPEISAEKPPLSS